MDLNIEGVAVWAAGIADEPGGLAGKLAALAGAGADLDFIIARRAPDKPGMGVVFVTPLRTDAEIAAGKEAGFAAAESLHCLRLMGPNEAGLAGRITQAIADAGVNIRGFSAGVAGGQCIIYVAFDSGDDAALAAGALNG